MTDYTAEEVEAAINEGFTTTAYDDDYEEQGWHELSYLADYIDSKIATVKLRGEDVVLTPVEADTGGEGHGEDVYFVFKIGDQLFRKDGYYASHYGTDWDGDFREVKAVEKTITVYE